jgi:hypothetical protein
MQKERENYDLVYDLIQKIHVSQQIVWIRIQFRIFRNGTVNLKSDFKILFWIEQKELLERLRLGTT